MRNQTNKVRSLTPFKAAVEQRGLPYTTARDKAQCGELPYFKFGRAWYVDERELEAFIESSRQRPESA